MPTERGARGSGRSELATAIERTIAIVALALIAPACRERVIPPPVAPRDGGAPMRRDSGPISARPDGGTDAAPIDASPSDAARGDGAAIEDGAIDGGVRAPVIDGVIGDAEWSIATQAVALIPGTGVFTGEQLDRLSAYRDSTRLYLAIEGVIAEGHSVIVYLDVDYGESTGVMLAGLTLADTDGALDVALSQVLYTAAPEVGVDRAWGSTSVVVAPTTSNEAVGWRDIATRTDSFGQITAGTLTACTEDGCETSIPLASLGAGLLDTIAIFARLTDSFQLSNQTLPLDDPGAPEHVSALLMVPPPES
jgi:hypothetical protein